MNMADILLNSEGDIKVDGIGEIRLTTSAKQAILIRLRWIFAEWRLGPDFGFPWFEDVLIKNPIIMKIKARIRWECLQVPGVTDARVVSVDFDKAARSATFNFTYTVNEEVYKEEITVYA